MPLQERPYRIDFFQLAVVANGEIASPHDVFEGIHRGELPAIAPSGGYLREVFGLGQRQRPSGFAAQFRKFRTSDLPEVGRAGRDAAELELLEGQGLIERNFFVYYRQHNLLGWHVNGHGSTPQQLAAYMAQLTGLRTTVLPVPVRGAVERLMRGDVIAKKIIASIPRPTNNQIVPDDDFAEDVLRLLAGADGDSMHLEINIDTRRADTAGGLAERAKGMLRALVGAGATTARAIVVEDGIEHPIDLILDRVKCTEYAETDGRYPPSQTMYRMIDAAFRESHEHFQAHFGEGGGVLR